MTWWGGGCGGARRLPRTFGGEVLPEDLQLKILVISRSLLEEMRRNEERRPGKAAAVAVALVVVLGPAP